MKNQTITKNKFAFIPTKIDKEWIWLKKYEAIYKIVECKDVDGMNTFYYDKLILINKKQIKTGDRVN